MQFLDYINQYSKYYYTFPYSSLQSNGYIKCDKDKLLGLFAAYCIKKEDIKPEKYGKILIKCAGHINYLVDIILTTQVDINVTNKKGWTPLRVALCAQNTSLAQIFIKHGAKTDELPKDGWTPLRIAIRTDKKSSVELLLSHGSSDAETYDGRTILEEAMLNQCHNVVEFFLERNIKFSSNEKCVSLYFFGLAQENKPALFQKLVEALKNIKGFDLNMTIHGKSVLAILLEKYFQRKIDKPSVVSNIKALIDAGCIILKHEATEYLRKIILKNEQGDENLDAESKFVEQLLRLGADPNGKIDKEPFLERISRIHHEQRSYRKKSCHQVIKLLLKTGAKFQASEIASKHFSYAINANDIELFSLLLETENKRTKRLVLTEACRNLRKEMVDIMLSNGFDINRKDEYGTPPLFGAIRSLEKAGRCEMIKWLLQEKNAYIHADSMEKYALYEAIANEHGGEQLMVIQCLIENGADINQASMVNDCRISPLYQCVEKRNFEAIKLLIEKGVSLDDICDPSLLNKALIMDKHDPDKKVSKYLNEIIQSKR